MKPHSTSAGQPFASCTVDWDGSGSSGASRLACAGVSTRRDRPGNFSVSVYPRSPNRSTLTDPLCPKKWPDFKMLARTSRGSQRSLQWLERPVHVQNPTWIGLVVLNDLNSGRYHGVHLACTVPLSRETCWQTTPAGQTTNAHDPKLLRPLNETLWVRVGRFWCDVGGFGKATFHS